LDVDDGHFRSDADVQVLAIRLDQIAFVHARDLDVRRRVIATVFDESVWVQLRIASDHHIEPRPPSPSLPAEQIAVSLVCIPNQELLQLVRRRESLQRTCRLGDRTRLGSGGIGNAQITR